MSNKSLKDNTIFVDGIINNANIATCDPESSFAYGLIESACIAWRNGKIIFVGGGEEIKLFSTNNTLDAKGMLITPGFIDCHTHLVFSGDRSKEFESRLQGKSYATIAQKGGGIMSTVRATRRADFSVLVKEAKKRLERLLESGVTTVEIKSGYGLNFDDEIKCLQVIKSLRDELPLTIKATCLAAHTLPTDFNGTAEDYINWVCEDLLPEVKEKQLADSVDIFCERIAFSDMHMNRLFETARALELDIKGHVEQLSQCHGTEQVCKFGGLSADHLEYANEEQIIKMSSAGVAAVLLPGAYYYLGESQKPPVGLLRKHHVTMAVATDLNPGSSPLYSITNAANMASVLFGLTPEESVMGITRSGARALGIDDRKGSLVMGMDADFVLWPFTNPRNLIYEMPAQKPQKIWVNGKLQPTLVEESNA